MHVLLFFSSGDEIATKLICYTRSSSIIHHLPTEYPKTTDSASASEVSKQYIEALIFEKVFATIVTDLLTVLCILG